MTLADAPYAAHPQLDGFIGDQWNAFKKRIGGAIISAGGAAPGCFTLGPLAPVCIAAAGAGGYALSHAQILAQREEARVLRENRNPELLHSGDTTVQSGLSMNDVALYAGIGLLGFAVFRTMTPKKSTKRK